MRFLNNSITAVILTALVSLGCGGSNKSTNSDNPQVPPNTSTYGVFRPLKASQGKVNQLMNTSLNQSITMSTPREGHKAIAIGNGKFLLFGGETNYTPTSTSTFDLFDSETERFTTLPVTTTRRREWGFISMSYAMLRLPNGKVLISGGTSDDSDTLEVLDPTNSELNVYQGSDLYNNVGEMFNIGNGRVLLFGLFRVKTGTYIHIVGNAVLNTNNWKIFFIDTPEKLYESSVVQLADGSVVWAGGNSEGEETSKSIYRLDAKTLVTTKIGEMSTPRVGHGMTVLQDGNIGVYGGVVYHGFGHDVDRLSSVEIISTQKDTLGSVTSKVPLLAARGCIKAVLLQNGYVLNAGGTNESGFCASSEFVHNHILNIAGTTGNLNTPRRMYSAIPLNNGRVLISGGFGDSVDAYNTAEIYDPATKIIISYDSTSEVVIGTVIHFSSENTGVSWSCTSNGSIDSATGVLTTLAEGDIVVTGKNTNGEASVTIKVIPAE